MLQIAATFDPTPRTAGATEDANGQFLASFDALAAKHPSLATIRWGVYFLTNGRRRHELHSGDHTLAQASQLHRELESRGVRTYIDAVN